jgi:hypothetical protein
VKKTGNTFKPDKIGLGKEQRRERVLSSLGGKAERVFVGSDKRNNGRKEAGYAGVRLERRFEPLQLRRSLLSIQRMSQ